MAGMTKTEREAAMRRPAVAARQAQTQADSRANRAECENVLRQWNLNVQGAQIRWAPGVLATADSLRRSGAGFRMTRRTEDRSGGRLVVTVEAVAAGYESIRSGGQDADVAPARRVTDRMERR